MSATKRIVTAVSLSALLFAAVAGIYGCKKTDDTIDKVVDSYLKEFYSSGAEGLTIEFIGDEAVIADFGNSYLGSNNSVINVGDIYIKNITRKGPNKWSADIIQGDYTLRYLNSVAFESTDLTLDGDNLTISNPDKWDIMWKKASKPTGGGSGDKCYEGTWYSPACGDSKGVIWTLKSDKTGSFSNKDCNGICTPMVFSFTYTVSGNTISVVYDALQPIVKCTGYADSRPPTPKPGSFTYTCDGDKLIVNSGNGPNTFNK